MVAGGGAAAYRQEPWRPKGDVLSSQRRLALRETNKLPPKFHHRASPCCSCASSTSGAQQRTDMGRGAVRLLVCVCITLASVATASAGPREERGRANLGAAEAAKSQPPEFGKSLAAAARQQVSYFVFYNSSY